MTTDSTHTNIRTATPADSATILELIKALADFEQLPPPDPEAQQRLISHAFGEHPRFEIFLAEVEGVVAGYAFIFETYSTFLARPSLYLEDLFVLKEYRGSKVGYDLFRFCVAEAQKRECGRMEWTVLDWNTHAQKFYRRMGARHIEEWQPYRLTREQFGEILV
ncbi:MAG: GNAT family N-acetyltransferase [Chloroflexi bacterium]|uniref:GNAT family N-acetyltransferase n=1 Tax=Candidatus Chlorohelix allophototropha TaxID=3003348 RepID=A0A8T7M550_9CHLR|nr:GNAT family N-acetyltransferase [Chloroflexota bacterium]WJW69104.1 GNAT family N-acetyltransferase [Chloroflexota bacterium L227-S17]